MIVVMVTNGCHGKIVLLAGSILEFYTIYPANISTTYSNLKGEYKQEITMK